jgi:hypothetical protein
MEHESFTKTFPVKPGRYIRRLEMSHEEQLMTVVNKGPLDLIYEINGTKEDPDSIKGKDVTYGATYCKLIPAKVAEVCYAEGWHAAQYAAQKLLGSYFPSYWNNNTTAKSFAEN